MEFHRVMLRLHYVPAGHGSPVCPKRSAPWDFGNIFLCVQVLFTVSVTGRAGKGAAESRMLQGALRTRPRPTTDASTFPPGPDTF